MRFVSYADRKAVAAALKPIYTAPTVDSAEFELLAFADSVWGKKYPATVAIWQNAWERNIGVPRVPARGEKDHLHDERDRR